MRLIPGPTQLDYSPRACAVTNRTDGDFIDFQVVIDRPEPTRLYMKTDIVEQAAKELGMVPGNEVATLRAEMDQLSAAIDEMKSDLEVYAAFEAKFMKEHN